MLEFDLLQCKGHVNEFYPAEETEGKGRRRRIIHQPMASVPESTSSSLVGVNSECSVTERSLLFHSD